MTVDRNNHKALDNLCQKFDNDVRKSLDKGVADINEVWAAHTLDSTSQKLFMAHARETLLHSPNVSPAVKAMLNGCEIVSAPSYGAIVVENTNTHAERNVTIGGKYDGYSTEYHRRAGAVPLFEHPKDVFKDIKIENIKQGDLSNCYFMAALGAVVQNNPQQVLKMFRDNGDGSYTVTFPGDPKHPITVPTPSGSELKMHAKEGGGCWARVLEKAYCAYSGKWSSSEDGNWKVESGGDPDKALHLLTGKGSSVVALSSVPDIADLVNRLGHERKPMCVWHTPRNNGQALLEKTFGISAESVQPAGVKILPNHVYTLGGMKDGQVWLRNPYGRPDSTDGWISMSPQDFKKCFDTMSTHSQYEK